MKYTNYFSMPKSFVDVVKRLTRDITEDDPKKISVTTLINPPRMRMLALRHWSSLEEDVSNHLWRILGSSIHYVMSKVEDTDRFIEERLEEKIDDFIVVGRPDLYEIKDKSVSDYKVTSVFAINSEKEEWIQQLNLYAFLYRKLGFQVNKAYIHAILRDWRRRETFKNKDYPKIPFKTIKIKLWSFKEQEDYIKERIKLHKEALDKKDEELVLCSEKERWKNDIRCLNYCLVAKKCSYWSEHYGK